MMTESLLIRREVLGSMPSTIEESNCILLRVEIQPPSTHWLKSLFFFSLNCPFVDNQLAISRCVEADTGYHKQDTDLNLG